MSRKCLDDSTFRRLWANGEPFVVTDVNQTLQGSWGPQYFIDVFGDQKVTVVDCETDLQVASTVSDFFRVFGSSSSTKRILKLKVCARCILSFIRFSGAYIQDWPPQSDFRETFPELFAAFIDAVPFPDHTRPDGVRNLVSHFALNGVVPDLGKIKPSYALRY